MIQFLMAAAPAAIDAAMAGFGASGRNQAAAAQQEAQKQQAEAQIRLNQQAAYSEWAGQQENYNQRVEQAALKHVEILKKRIRAEGSFSAQEGQVGKTAKRRKTILATGAAGFDMAALNKSTESAKQATINKMESTARTLDQRNNQALSIIKPYAKESVFGAVAGSLAKSGLSMALSSMKFKNPMENTNFADKTKELTKGDNFKFPSAADSLGENAVGDFFSNYGSVG